MRIVLEINQDAKLDAKQREKLLVALNRVKSDYSFGKIKTFRNLLFSLGLNDKSMIEKGYFPFELDATIDKNFIWSYLQDIKLSHEVEVFLKHNPPLPDTEFPPILHPSISLDTTKMVIETFDEEHFKTYKLTSSPKEPKDLFLFWFQKKAAKELLENILSGRRGQLLLAGVGVGKTFILGSVIRRLLDNNFTEHKTLSPFPIVYVTKSSIVEQTQRVLKKFFNIDEQDVTVINIEQLRARFGSMFVKEEIKFEGGQEKVIWTWRKNVYPALIIWDECQVLKNTDSTQSKIAQSYNEIDSEDTYQIFSSATPFTRVCEAKCFAVATRIPFTFGIAKDAPLTNAHWSTFSEEVAHPSDPIEHSPPAVDRLIDKLDPYIVRVKGVKSQFKAINSVEMIDFENDADKKYYQDAWENYLKEKAKLENLEGITGGSYNMEVLAKFLKFRQAAEFCRASYLARKMYEAVTTDNLAAVAALNFKNSITKIVRHLIEDYGVPRDQISLIWGGATKSKKQKDSEKKKKIKDKMELSPDVLAALEAEGITLADLDLDVIEEQPEFTKDIPDEYKLGAQSLKERQKEIDKFQSGKSLYCLYTFRAGGVGLSLHHTDEFTTNWAEYVEGYTEWANELFKLPEKEQPKKGKVRHKESGYAVEADIKFIPTRQRINFVAPTYSAIELVQGLGRTPRLTSLSNTVQKLVFYKGTIEERVAYIVSVKLRCLGKVVRQKEDWADVAVKTHVDDIEVKHTKPEDNVPDEDTGYVAVTEIEEEE